MPCPTYRMRLRPATPDYVDAFHVFEMLGGKIQVVEEAEVGAAPVLVKVNHRSSF